MNFKWVTLKFLFFLFIIYFFPNSNIEAKSKIKKVGDIELVYLRAGTFTMGSNNKDSDNFPARKVTITENFYIGKYEITQKQYRDIMGKDACRKSEFGCGEFHPVYNIDWYDAIEFCNRLSKKHGFKPFYIINKFKKDPNNIFRYDNKKWIVEIDKKANGFRLPTEAQWEYACRAGTKTTYYWGNGESKSRIHRYALYLFNSGYNRIKKGIFWYTKNHKTSRIGSKRPNRWGLYDMCGNVSEWCWDRFKPDYFSNYHLIDPHGYNGKFIARVVRGGSILDSKRSLKSYFREASVPNNGSHAYGMRVVLPIK